MKYLKKLSLRVAAGAIVGSIAATTQEADVNVAFFLEWATPNQIAK